jgi:uncharacterized membrane protein YidH (DUF202 family)
MYANWRHAERSERLAFQLPKRFTRIGLMRLLSTKTKHLLRESLQTFIVAVAFILFAVGLTFVEDWCIALHRPAWLVKAIEALSIIMFLTDSLVLLAVCARVGISVVREFLENERKR